MSCADAREKEVRPSTVLGPILLLVAILPTSGASQQGLQREILDPTRGARIDIVAPWAVDEKDFICIISRVPASGDSAATRLLQVFPAGSSTEKPVFELQTADNPVSAFTTRDSDGRFVIVWTGASAYHIQVLAHVQGKVQLVLEAASRAFPEVTFDARGNELILATDLRLQEGEWTTRGAMTHVFTWSGKQMENLGDVPWARRFDCRSKPSCRAVQK